MINESKTYSEFLGRVKSEIEINILKRIETSKLDLAKKYKMDKSRVIQLSEILKRVSIPEMAHIKFGTNFGISVDTINFVTKKVYFASPKNIQKYLDQVEDNEEFLLLYVYFCFCTDLAEGNR